MNKDVKIELFGGNYFVAPIAQDDTGCAAGIAVDEDRLRARLNQDQALWCKNEIVCSRGRVNAVLAVCRVKIESLDLDVWTTIAGIPDLSDPSDSTILVGRFMIGDAQIRVYVGSLSSNVSLPLNEKERITENYPQKQLDVGAVYSISQIPSWDELLTRFVLSDAGKHTKQLVRETVTKANSFYAAGDIELAVSMFRTALVYSFFTHNVDSQSIIASNLAKALAALGEYKEAISRAEYAIKLVTDISKQTAIGRLITQWKLNL